jgi:hypothetical protein
MEILGTYLKSALLTEGIFICALIMPIALSKVFAFQAEALIKLQNHDEAESALIDAPKFDVNEATKFFGTIANAYFLMVQAQVDMAVGRLVFSSWKQLILSGAFSIAEIVKCRFFV